MSERKIKLQIKDMTKKYDNGDGVEHKVGGQSGLRKDK